MFECVCVCVAWLVEDLDLKCFSLCVCVCVCVCVCAHVIGPLSAFVPLFECQWLYSFKTSVGIIFLLFAGIKSDDLQAR